MAHIREILHLVKGRTLRELNEPERVSFSATFRSTTIQQLRQTASSVSQTAFLPCTTRCTNKTTNVQRTLSGRGSRSIDSKPSFLFPRLFCLPASPPATSSTLPPLLLHAEDTYRGLRGRPLFSKVSQEFQECLLAFFRTINVDLVPNPVDDH